MRIRASGWAFLISFMLGLLAAWNTGANLLYLVVGGIGSFIVVSLIIPVWNLRGLSVIRSAPDAAHRGEPFGVTLRINNAKRTPAGAVRIERAGPSPATAAIALYVPARSSIVLRTSWTFPNRGVHRLPAMNLRSGFPFGFFERSRPIRDEVEVVVYPRVKSVRTAWIERLPGPRAAPRIVRGEGDEFFSLRDYVPGDDVRHIAWRASAKRGSLLVREMARETSRYVVFALDTHRPPDTPDFDDLFEEAVEMVASLAVALLNRQYIVSVVSPGRRLPGSEGKSQIRRVLDMLARVTPSDDPAHGGFGWFNYGEEYGRASYAFIAADPRQWGRRLPFGGSRVIALREVPRA
ncbi:MAG TPA: DUF58 domain-containing protein [Candidatus Hydrogenedentes bacterium]|nr:DUF58 domain-containing protein [Candidatus Hydrogenedentota bacterium]HOV75762.1 DUF58 domain-containing protein [Candidatus Hydrogenedentota bacterium]HPC17337.1 DUF58 domain-containing protein [Candidatus Hydrogenedentota bacterium]HRT20071.1 DUF58 domain-containing protein [Candidatus Hydrogenedentota bacterium]HRT64865.1 DUF58 domain-containing protein [Candidatus Hydrogenedentota bacterium]